MNNNISTAMNIKTGAKDHLCLIAMTIEKLHTKQRHNLGPDNLHCIDAGRVEINYEQAISLLDDFRINGHESVIKSLELIKDK